MNLLELIDDQLKTWIHQIPHSPPLIVGLSGPQGNQSP